MIQNVFVLPNFLPFGLGLHSAPVLPQSKMNHATHSFARPTDDGCKVTPSERTASFVSRHKPNSIANCPKVAWTLPCIPPNLGPVRVTVAEAVRTRTPATAVVRASAAGGDVSPRRSAVLTFLSLVPSLTPTAVSFSLVAYCPPYMRPLHSKWHRVISILDLRGPDCCRCV